MCLYWLIISNHIMTLMPSNGETSRRYITGPLKNVKGMMAAIAQMALSNAFSLMKICGIMDSWWWKCIDLKDMDNMNTCVLLFRCAKCLLNLSIWNKSKLSCPFVKGNDNKAISTGIDKNDANSIEKCSLLVYLLVQCWVDDKLLHIDVDYSVNDQNIITISCS